MSNRRAFLAALGAGWVGYGALGMLGQPTYGRSRGLADLTRYVPLDVLGWAWILCGLLAIVAAAVRACPRVQAAGFTALAVPAAAWAAAFAHAYFTGYAGAAGSACGWTGFALGVYFAAGMTDPVRT